jgi:uncharacterized protein YndB with AHSA1/START domain
MARAEASVVINRPVQELWDYLSDVSNVPVWMSYVLEAEQTSEGPLGVGTKFQGVSHFLGRRIQRTSEVTQIEPNSGWKEKVSAPPIAFEESYIFESVEGGTESTFVVDGHSGGFFRLTDPIVVRMMQRDIEANVGNLKDILEA